MEDDELRGHRALRRRHRRSPVDPRGQGAHRQGVALRRAHRPRLLQPGAGGGAVLRDPRHRGHEGHLELRLQQGALPRAAQGRRPLPPRAQARRGEGHPGRRGDGDAGGHRDRERAQAGLRGGDRLPLPGLISRGTRARRRCGRLAPRRPRRRRGRPRRGSAAGTPAPPATARRSPPPSRSAAWAAARRRPSTTRQAPPSPSPAPSSPASGRRSLGEVCTQSSA